MQVERTIASRPGVSATAAWSKAAASDRLNDTPSRTVAGVFRKVYPDDVELLVSDHCFCPAFRLR